MTGSLLISELSARTGFSPSALRYYEQVGLLAAAERSSGGYRLYDEAAVGRLRFIDRAKQLGLPLEEIRELALVWEGGLCAHVQERLREHVRSKSAQVAARIEELNVFAAQLDQTLGDLTGPPVDGRCNDGCGCADSGADVAWAPQLIELAPTRRAMPSRRPAAPPEGGADAPVACTLAARDQPGRVTEWRELLSQVAGREAIDGGVRLRLPPQPDLVGRLADLAAREQACCSFFTFTLRLGSDAVTLDVRAPVEAVELLEDLFGSPL